MSATDGHRLAPTVVAVEDADVAHALARMRPDDEVAASEGGASHVRGVGSSGSSRQRCVPHLSAVRVPPPGTSDKPAPSSHSDACRWRPFGTASPAGAQRSAQRRQPGTRSELRQRRVVRSGAERQRRTRRRQRPSKSSLNLNTSIPLARPGPRCPLRHGRSAGADRRQGRSRVLGDLRRARGRARTSSSHCV